MFVELAVTCATVQQADVERSCAAYCAGIVMTRLGLERPRFPELQNAVNEDDHGYTSLFATGEALRQLGLVVEAIDPGPKPPAEIAIAAVVTPDSVGRPHFVVVEPLEQDLILLYSPPHWVDTASWASVRGSVRGPILAITSRPSWWASGVLVGAAAIALATWCLARKRALSRALAIVALVGSCLVVGACTRQSVRVSGGPTIDVGRVGAGESVEITVINDGDPATIVDFTSSCGCALLNLQPGMILASGEGRLSMALNASEGERRQARFAIRFASRHEPLSFAIHFEGGKAAGLKYQRDMRLGSVTLGMERTVTFEVTLEEASARLAHLGVIERIRWRSSVPSTLRIDEYTRSAEWGNGRVLDCSTTLVPGILGQHTAVVTCEIGEIHLDINVTWMCVPGALPSVGIVVLSVVGDLCVGEVILDEDEVLSVSELVSASTDFEATIVKVDGISKLRISCPARWASLVGVGWVRLEIRNGSGIVHRNVRVVAQ